MTLKCFLLIGNQAQSLVNFRGKLLCDIKSLGYETHAIAPDFDQHHEASNFLSKNGIIMHQVYFSRAGLNPLGDLLTFMRFFKLIRQVKPDFVLSYTAKPVIWGGFAAWMARVPHRFALITGLGYGFIGVLTGKRKIISKIMQVLYRLVLKKAEKIFFQNPDDQALFRHNKTLSNPASTCVVNGSGVDLQNFVPAPLPDAPLRFLMIARLLGDKGVREYANAAKIAKKKHSEIQFHLVGDVDSYNPDSVTHKEVQEWQNEGDIIWHGAVKDVRPYITNCHMFVLPSYREGIPRATLEAMAMARAIITTDAPGCKETVIDGENGFLVPIADAGALASTMERFVANPTLIEAFGNASRKLAQERYDVNKVNLVMLNTMGMMKK